MPLRRFGRTSRRNSPRGPLRRPGNGGRGRQRWCAIGTYARAAPRAACATVFLAVLNCGRPVEFREAVGANAPASLGVVRPARFRLVLRSFLRPVVRCRQGMSCPRLPPLRSRVCLSQSKSRRWVSSSGEESGGPVRPGVSKRSMRAGRAASCRRLRESARGTARIRARGTLPYGFSSVSASR